MRTTLLLLTILFVTLSLAMATSLLLEIQIIAAHWSRVSLVLLLMFLELVIGGLMFYQKIKEIKASIQK